MSGRTPLAGLAAAALLALPAGAILDRYHVRDVGLGDFQAATPKTFIAGSEPGDGDTTPSTAVVDRAGPVLRKLLFANTGRQTTFVNTFNGFIWFAQNFRDGPRGFFTATSSTLGPASNLGTVGWPVVTGYAITGATFCNANPSFICSLAVGSHLATVEPDLRSSFYDLGPWEFHGTGFTSGAFVFFTSTLPGNSQVLVKGAGLPDATVPALPLLGTTALGAGLLALGSAALKRRAR